MRNGDPETPTGTADWYRDSDGERASLAGTGAITAISSLATGALGYGARWLQAWYQNRSDRDARQREIAGKAQLALDDVIKGIRAWSKYVRAGDSSTALEVAREIDDELRAIERLAANLNDSVVAPLARRFREAVQGHVTGVPAPTPMAEVESVRDELRARLGRYFH